MTDLPTDIRQFSISRVSLGLIISVSIIAGTIAWSSSRLVSRIDQLEASVAAIQASMDLQSYARVEDVSEDLDTLWFQINELEDSIDDVMDSVGYLLEQTHVRQLPGGP